MFLVAVIAILYVVGFIFRWNYSLWWYDLFLHFLGGMWVAIFANKFLRGSTSLIFMKSNLVRPLFIIALVALAGVSWEIYEFTIDELFFEERALWRAQDGNTDTMSDLIMDLLGGAVVVSYMTYRSYKSHRLNKNNEI